MEDFLSAIFNVLLPGAAAKVNQNPTLSLAITIFLATFLGVGWLVAQRRAEASQQAQDRRDDQIIAMQRIRLTETNPGVKHRLKLLNPASRRPLVSFELQLSNLGDGPIDILCALLSGRILDTDDDRELGTRGRNIEWSDHTASYWNDTEAKSIFSGISTVKSMMSSADQYLRLAPGASGILRRKDAIRKSYLPVTGSITLKYQGFVVARGYPLGEIWSQLGGRPPDLRKTLDLARLQFRAIARPNLHRWRCVQESLLNLNRLVFRLALEEVGSPDAQDPLGKLTQPDAWRFFLLHHMDFVGPSPATSREAARNALQRQGMTPSPALAAAWSRDVTVRLEELTDRIKGPDYLPDLVVPDGFASASGYQNARKLCYEELRDVVETWMTLARVIDECARYRIDHYHLNDGQTPCYQPVSPMPQSWPEESANGWSNDWPDEGYPVRIHTDPVYQERWLEYMREGYLISKPFPRKGMGENNYNATDIPDDPRDLEPYVILSLSLDTTLDIARLNATPTVTANPVIPVASDVSLNGEKAR